MPAQTGADRGAKRLGGLLTVLLVTFVVLKVTGVVDWSWWVVTAPLTVPFIVAAFFNGLAAALGASDG